MEAVSDQSHRTCDGLLVATGYFRGVSFSPDGTQVVFGLAQGSRPSARTDLARAPVTGGPVKLLTHDGVSGWPLWGPGGKIAFSRRTKITYFKVYGETRTREAFDLYVMKAGGGGARRMTKVGYEAGVFPGFWLPSGERLVANFHSLEKNYAALGHPGARGSEASEPADQLAGGRPTLIDRSCWSPSWSGLPTVGVSPC